MSENVKVKPQEAATEEGFISSGGNPSSLVIEQSAGAQKFGSKQDFVSKQDYGSKQVGHIPPNSLEAERSVLGAVLLDNEALNGALEVIRPEDFYNGNHSIIFQGMLNLQERSEPIDMITLHSELDGMGKLSQVGGTEYLSWLLDKTPFSGNIQFYARTIKEMSIRRKLITAASSIADEAFNGRGEIEGFIDSVEERIFKISEARLKQGFVRVGEIVGDAINKVQELYENNDPITGIPTGFTDLDHVTSGFQASDLIILAGRPGMGKTALALAIARHVAFEHGGGVAVFSLEMSKEQITTRLLCSEARVSNKNVRSGSLAEGDFPRLVDSAAKMSTSNLFIDETPAISVLELRAKARRLHREHKLDMVIVDYLQLMRGSKRNSERREQEISEISGSLKALAKELSIPVIALSQLNRGVESRIDKRPNMADLRESGAIEQDADIVSFVYRDEVYNEETPEKGVAELIIAKHRNGEVGTVKLAFQGQYALFENLAAGEDYDYLPPDDDDDFI